MKLSMLPVLLRRMAALAVLGTVLTGAWAEEPIVLRFSHIVSATDPKGIGAELFRKRVEERLANKVRVEVFPGGELFTDEQIFEALWFRDVHLAAPSLSKFRNLTQRLQVFDLPFLFEDVEAVHRFQDSETGQQLLNAAIDKGIKGLAYWDNGMRVLSAPRSLRSPEDAAGLKFRIESSAVIEAQYEILDALPVRLPFGRVYDALSSGLVDAQENSWSNSYSQQFHRFNKDFTETNHSFLGYMVIVNVLFWESLPPDIRTELEKILAEVSVEVRRIAQEKAQSSRQAIVAEGAQVLELGPAEREAWINTLKPVWQQFEAEIGKEVIDAAVAAGRK
jgi:C4-dicarboxylate-binding protein DctP